MHLTRVMRLGAGDAVRVFDGRGHEFDAAVEHVARLDVRVRLGAPRAAAAELPLALVLAPALLKGDKMDDVIRDATMLGATSVEPLWSQRCEVALATVEQGRRRERWQRVAIASAKQCQRAWVPDICPPRRLESWLADAAGAAGALAVMLVEPGAAPAADTIAGLELGGIARLTVLVGPEGGWTEDEVRLAGRRCRVITLRTPTLRADAAPIVAMTALLTKAGLL